MHLCKVDVHQKSSNFKFSYQIDLLVFKLFSPTFIEVNDIYIICLFEPVYIIKSNYTKQPQRIAEIIFTMISYIFDNVIAFILLYHMKLQNYEV